jgi:hypothetical protein
LNDKAKEIILSAWIKGSDQYTMEIGEEMKQIFTKESDWRTKVNQSFEARNNQLIKEGASSLITTERSSSRRAESLEEQSTLSRS